MARRAADDGFKDHALDQLAPAEARSMFGGWGLYRDGACFAIVYRGRLYLKTDEAGRARFIAEGMKPFRPAPGKTLKSFYEAPPEVLEDRSAAQAWAERAMEAATRRKPGPGRP